MVVVLGGWGKCACVLVRVHARVMCTNKARARTHTHERTRTHVTPQDVIPTQDVIIAAICNTIYARCNKYAKCDNFYARCNNGAFECGRIYRVYEFRLGNNVRVTSQLVFTSRELVTKKAAPVSDLHLVSIIACTRSRR